MFCENCGKEMKPIPSKTVVQEVPSLTLVKPAPQLYFCWCCMDYLVELPYEMTTMPFDMWSYELELTPELDDFIEGNEI
jgi:hypothetical protein